MSNILPLTEKQKQDLLDHKLLLIWQQKQDRERSRRRMLPVRILLAVFLTFTSYACSQAAGCHHYIVFFPR